MTVPMIHSFPLRFYIVLLFFSGFLLLFIDSSYKKEQIVKMREKKCMYKIPVQGPALVTPQQQLTRHSAIITKTAERRREEVERERRS